MAILIALLAALIGLGITLYIYNKQRAKKPLMCPRRSPCETVISSPEAKIFGISNTILGMTYYVLTAAFLIYFGTGHHTNLACLFFITMTTLGFLFSMYLVGVQHFKIKQWCVWCLGSAVMSTVIFGATVAMFL
ncbi:MAG: vitamin K epoxide reductase family protein [Candidatus Paceibacterota bacterium]